MVLTKNAYKAQQHEVFATGANSADYELVKDRVYVALGFMEHKFNNRLDSVEPDYAINKERVAVRLCFS